MFEKTLKVRFLNKKDSFCYVCPKIAAEFESNSVAKLLYGNDKEAYFSVSSIFCPENEFGICSYYAKQLGIEDDSIVTLTKVQGVCNAESVTISTIREEDYYVLEQLANEIEVSVLNQTRVVCENQKLILWIGVNLCFPVEVASVSPNKIGLLNNFNDIILLGNKEKKSKMKEKYLCKAIPTAEEVQKRIENNIFAMPLQLTTEEIKQGQILTNYLKRMDSFQGRIVPFDCLKSEFSNYLSEFNVFMLKSVICKNQRHLKSFDEPLFCSLEVGNSTETKKIFVRLFIIEPKQLDSYYKHNIYVHENIFSLLNCKLGVSVYLTLVKKNSATEKIVIQTMENVPNIIDSLKEYLADMTEKQNEFVLNSDVVMDLKGVLCKFKFLPNSSKYCCVNEEFLRHVKYDVEVNQPIAKLVKREVLEKLDCHINIESHKRILDHVLNKLKTSLLKSLSPNHFLITGNIGSGKSTLIENIRRTISEVPFAVYTEVLKGKNLKGKTLESLHRTILTTIENLIYHQPSIWFLDDLHIICANLTDDNGQTQNALYFDRHAEMLYSIITSVTSSHRIGIIATTVSINKLNKNIYSSRGERLFDDNFKIHSLTKGDRKFILEELLKNDQIQVDIENISVRTEGYVFQDMADLFKKAKFQAIKQDADNIIIKNEHFAKAMSQMTPLSLAGVKLHSPGDKNFSSIGGMFKIKKQLEESLMWPLKYPSLFENAPLRQQTGILLYGPPGTGKTAIVIAAAEHFNLKLIPIKGPELFSKYIGSSEEAVRRVFQQAQNAKPCVLFFDEFESFAPRRGHDSSGVTDRVVNQLLTEMDGFESLSGVCVIVATTRPDLLDPAMLRPGRLDKQILCPLPDENCRLDILTVLSRNLTLSDDVNLSEIAKKTDGFSGADLKSLLCNAQLSATEDNKEGNELKPITVEMLEKSFSNTKPSLTREEKKKHDLIYSKFQGNLDISLLLPGTKATLA